MFVCPECGASQPVEARCIADGTPLVPTGDDLLLGQTIGAYRIARLMGIGGMGRVYKGVHPQIGSRVAIKVLSRECSDRRDLVERFFSEAKAVNLIRHESIVNVLDLSTLPDGRPYIVMEYLDGSPLAAIIESAQRSGTRLPIGGLARLVAEVLDALAAAHAKGIVHRDLKPDNIYVTPSGRPKVLDFGIAKLQPELGGSATHTGSLLGTPHYMSPEQASGRPVDARADLYALGVILFECATLQKPFFADSLFDLLRKHVEAPPPSPRALRPDMPVALEHIIYTALAKLPDHRFGSAQAMSMALQHATMQLPADQWAPITPTSISRQGGWAPTPPASWGTTDRQRPMQHSTATAGQVTSPPKSGSRKGLWIGLGALLLVGGGITAAVVASGGSETAASGSAGSAGSAVVVAETPQTPPTGTPWDDIPTAPSDPDDTDDTDDTDDKPDKPDKPDVKPAKTKPGKADPADAFDIGWNAQVDEALGKMITQLPPEARKMLPADLRAALAKHGSWAKIPEAQRKKMAARLASGDWATAAMAGVDDALSTTPATPTPPPKAAAGLGPDGWLVYRRMPPPAGFNVKKLDGGKWLSFALAEARKLVPDGKLFRIDAGGVYPDGHVDVTIVEHGSLDYRFISPSRSKRDPKAPIGAKTEWKCMFRVMIDKEGPWTAAIDGWECKEKLLGPPKCTFAQVWKKALAKGAPANAVANLGYRESGGVAKWFFGIDGTSFSEIFPDDC